MYQGPAPFSEPETLAVARFLANHNDSIQAYLAYHSFSQLWMLPFSHSKQKKADNLDQLVRNCLPSMKVCNLLPLTHPRTKQKQQNFACRVETN